MKILVIDGNSILNRAFYGIRLLTTKDGLFTNAIYGFLTTYFKLLEEEKPDKAMVCFDVRAKTFRHKQFEDYKANRTGMPEELALQMPIIKEVLDALGVDRYELEGYEADDLIGTISKYCEDTKNECVIVTGDKDSLQLANEYTSINLVSTRMGKTTTKKYTKDVFVEEYGFLPPILTDLKGLMGDKSDNIPGVLGIGEKTAMTLLHAFKNIEGIYENIDSDIIKKGAREKLLNDRDNAYKSRELATIFRDVPFKFSLDNNKNQDNEKLLLLFEKLEFANFIKKFELKSEKLPEVEIVKPKFEYVTKTSEIDVKNPVFVSGTLEKLVVYSGDVAYILQDPTEEMLKYIFSKYINKIVHNGKDLILKLMEKGILAEGIVFDTALAMYLIDPAISEYKLDDMCYKFLGVKPKFEDNAPTLFETNNNIDNDLIKVEILKLLYPILEPKMQEYENLYYNIEMPLMTVLADMQYCGIKIDKQELVKYGEKLKLRLNELTNIIHKLAGVEFNINSPKQLGEVLFEKIGLKAPKKTKTGYSTNAEVLEFIKNDHEIIMHIIEYRTYSKLYSTYVEGLLKVIKNDGKIHSTFNQMVTTTGRLSSTDPNLQNIPIRTPLGSKLRKMFTVSSDEYTLIDADYSQIELRILAHIANDAVMIDAFKQGIDIHTVTASQVFNVEIKDVTQTMRSHAKAVNFGIVYGISEFSLANDIGVSRGEAKEYMENYFKKYSGVKKYMDNIKEKAHKDLVVSTLFGRRRELLELKSKNFNIRSFGERVALNTPIQGTAADIIKIAMVNVYNRLLDEKLDAKLLLQVHDELIIEAKNDIKDYVASILKEEMETAFKGQVSLLVEYGFGKNWYEAK